MGKQKIGIVGAGFSGAVIAREFAQAGHTVVVFDERDHIAGNCHTELDAETNVMVHRYGPHIFHTGDDEVWAYVNQFSRFMPYVNRVKAVVNGSVYSMPINLHTINQFFGTVMSPDEALAFIQGRARSDIKTPQNFEEQALAFVGSDIYEGFFAGYTRKQWGVEPTELPASILKRLPLRFTYDDNYFNHPHQGMPEHGYTALVEGILDVDGIELRLGETFEGGDFDHVFYSGAIDRYFNYDLGYLGYRTLDFEEIRSDGEVQGTAVINYCDVDVPWTRIAEHKHFAPWRLGEVTGSVAFKEHSRMWEPGDTAYYPLRLVNDKALLEQYVQKAKAATGVTFVGRLGTYRYLDMDVTIREALDAARASLAAIEAGEVPQSFYVDPI